MSNSFVFRRLAEDKMDDIIHTFNLRKILSNNRTTIYENRDMRLSEDRKVVRILFFDENQILLEELRNAFYGEEYTTI